MLDDRERRALREVERHIRSDDPQFVRSFDADAAQLSASAHRRGAWTAGAVAALLAAVMLLAGSPAAALAFVACAAVVWASWRYRGPGGGPGDGTVADWRYYV